jgi:hypothetical protein
MFCSDLSEEYSNRSVSMVDGYLHMGSGMGRVSSVIGKINVIGLLRALRVHLLMMVSALGF